MARPCRRQQWLHSDSLLCCSLQDEISTGLDSSTTFLITKCIRNFVHMQDVRASALGRPMLQICLILLLPLNDKSGKEVSQCVVLPLKGLCLRSRPDVQATVLLALLQPAPETYELFDDVLLLSEGGTFFCPHTAHSFGCRRRC